MKKSRKIIKILCLSLAFIILTSVVASTVYAKTSAYTYDYGTATMTLLSYKVSARLKSDNSANLKIWGAYQYLYTNSSGDLKTSSWVTVSNYSVYGTDTGASGWGTSIPNYTACSLHNMFLRNSLLVLDKYLYISNT